MGVVHRFLGFFLVGLIGLVMPHAIAHAQGRAPGQTFRDCPTCPQMTVVPPGSVVVGDPKDYDDDDGGARPKVSIAKPFAIGTFEVTQAEWEAVVGNNPSPVKGPNLPVVQVTWRQVKDYIAKLNAQTGKSYRLPSEAEWEYAARAGSAEAYAFGKDDKLLPQYGWFDANSGNTIQPVGKLKPNAFGLYDMHGNVWEWTEDCQGSDYAGKLPEDFAKERESFCFRVIRGGSVQNYPKHLTAYYRASLTPVNFNTNLGFRLATHLP